MKSTFHAWAGLPLAMMPLAALALDFKVTTPDGSPLEQAVIEARSDQTSNSPPATRIIDQVDKRFSPDFLLINRGDSVDFPNSDNIRHHVYSFSPAKTFELKLYADRPEHPVLFDKHGVAVLGCNIHDSMVGYVYIASQPAAVSDTNGEASLDTSADSISVWHRDQRNGPEQLSVIPLSELQLADDQQTYLIVIDTVTAAPRDTFRDTFGAPSTE